MIKACLCFLSYKLRENIERVTSGVESFSPPLQSEEGTLVLIHWIRQRNRPICLIGNNQEILLTVLFPVNADPSLKHSSTDLNRFISKYDPYG